MRFKIVKYKAAEASNSTAIDKSANDGVGGFGLMGDIHRFNQHFPKDRG